MEGTKWMPIHCQVIIQFFFWGDKEINQVILQIAKRKKQQIRSWPWKQIWRSETPRKVSCFTWLIAKEVALTQDNLKKKRIHTLQ